MLKHSRVSSALDIGRLGEALARPGMDTRIWSSLAVVKRVTVDPAEGVFVDLVMMPSRNRGTARIGSEYAGNGFGLHAPLEVEDEVLVEAPSGDPNEGLVVTRRLHSASDPPPQQAVAHPSDFVLVVKGGQSMRLLVGVTDKVVLGDDAAAESSVRGSTYRGAEDTMLQALALALTEIAAGLTALSQSAANTTAAATAVTNFLLAAQTYLTGRVVLP